jgi:hypothetical protein
LGWKAVVKGDGGFGLEALRFTKGQGALRTGEVVIASEKQENFGFSIVWLHDRLFWPEYSDTLVAK